MSEGPLAVIAGSPLGTPLLLDACAILSWLDPDGQETAVGRARIDDVFATVDLTTVNVTVPTVVEVATVLSRKFGLEEEARSIGEDLSSAGIHIVAFGIEEAAHVSDVLHAEKLTRQAELDAGRKVGRLSLGDRIAMAAAEARRNTLVTTDQFVIQVSGRMASNTFDYRAS
ncbi:MAG: PIN domain-containing protein [Janthinobacterium lividum]